MFKVKICGLTNLEDALWALDKGADYLGFVLYPKSPRYLSPDALAHIVEHLPAHARPVGVFVNADPVLVKQVVAACRLVAVQLNGDECFGDFSDLSVPVWRAVRLISGMWQPSPDDWKVERFILDAASPEYGGSGVKIDWEAGREFALHHQVMLAGGLDSESVADAVRQVRPMGVDVSSGVECFPGKKDFRKVADFIAHAKAAAGVKE